MKFNYFRAPTKNEIAKSSEKIMFFKKANEVLMFTTIQKVNPSIRKYHGLKKSKFSKNRIPDS